MQKVEKDDTSAQAVLMVRYNTVTVLHRNQSGSTPEVLLKHLPKTFPPSIRFQKL